MKANEFIIPNSLRFADLALTRHPDSKRVQYDQAALARLFRANELELVKLRDEEEVVCWLVAEFYLAHLRAGGKPDAVGEEILAEIAAAEASDISTLLRRGDPLH
jgi:hypothetical protein